MRTASFLPVIVTLLVGTLLAPLPAAAAAPVASPAGSVTPVPSPSATPSAAAPAAIARLGFEVVSRRPHDTTAWTEGLLMDPGGRLFESTGINGESQVRELDPLTGAVLRSVPVPADAYGEGLALVGDRLLVQLTWQEGIAIAYDKESFAVLETFGYEGEGWGLCFDGTHLVMSNGSDMLTFRDPATFGVLGQVAVTAGGEPVPRLNELECVEGEVWANVWETDWIVRIDPVTGAVTGALDTTGLLEPHPARTDRGAVLNGIARIPGGDTWLLTGKRWPEAIEVRITEP